MKGCAGQLSIGIPEETIVFGIPIPSVDTVFLDVARFHIVVAIVYVLAGVMAMLSRKGRGRHASWGSIYYWCLATASLPLRGFRWCVGPITIICSCLAPLLSRQQPLRAVRCG